MTGKILGIVLLIGSGTLALNAQNWEVTKETDNFTDVTTATIRTEGSSEKSFSFTCVIGMPVQRIFWFVDSGYRISDQTVEVRFGDAPVERFRFTDVSEVAFMMIDQVERFMGHALDENVLRLRWRGVNVVERRTEEMISTFRMMGLNNALVEAGCSIPDAQPSPTAPRVRVRAIPPISDPLRDPA